MGRVTGAVHKNDGPSAAPAVAYVPIADGSSSAAPVISPRPSDLSTSRDFATCCRHQDARHYRIQPRHEATKKNSLLLIACPDVAAISRVVEWKGKFLFVCSWLRRRFLMRVLSIVL